VSKALSTLALIVALAFATSASAKACFATINQCQADIFCSYNADGTGGYYLAHSYYITNCRSAW
jgi:hypothetical protein